MEVGKRQLLPTYTKSRVTNLVLVQYCMLIVLLPVSGARILKAGPHDQPI